LKVANEGASKIKDIPLADRCDLLAGSFTENVAVNDPRYAFSLIVLDKIGHWFALLCAHPLLHRKPPFFGNAPPYRTVRAAELRNLSSRNPALSYPEKRCPTDE
jgi:hypothetical protein